MNTKYRDYLSGQRALQQDVTARLAAVETSAANHERNAAALDEARTNLTAVLMATQIDAKLQIEEIVSLLLKSVYGDEFGFEISYEERRNNSEADFFLIQGNEREEFTKNLPHPGGVNDVCALGLRIALWALSSPRSAPVLLCDAPAKFVNGAEIIERFGRVLKSISDELEIQIISVGQDSGFAGVADKAWLVQKRGGESKTKELVE